MRFLLRDRDGDHGCRIYSRPGRLHHLHDGAPVLPTDTLRRGIRVRDDEIDPFQAAFNHLIDRVATTSADTNHLDVCTGPIVPKPKRLINH